jgi:hypothetical protein
MRKDQHKVSVTVDGRDTGVWDVLTGNETDSEETKYKPGGMAPPISLGGSAQIGQTVISRNYTLERDHAIIHWLIDRVGRANVVVTKNVLDPDKNVYGKPLVTRGILKRVTPPEVDSQSADAAMIEIEISPTGVVTW